MESYFHMEGVHMAYTALYRKFRPLKFADMVGQDSITRTLKNQIMANRVGHAYLFNGGRGTGKTTSAKILARAVNCLSPVDGEPCNECEICKEILDGSLTDVVEMDAASNNGVEDIRKIRDEVNFLPTKAKYRVYIIDEVHMLSIGAFNALLKTLEEPPAHVKFILATTEPQKIPVTILSRCQRFDYKKISEEDIEKRLKVITKEASINIEDGAIHLISVLAEGAVRDGISILERCYQEGTEVITEELVRELVGIPSAETLYNISKNIIENDECGAINSIEEVLDSGKDVINLLWELIKYFKDILIFKSTGNLKVYNEKEIAQIKELSEEITKEKLLNIIYVLSELENDMKRSSQKIIILEATIIKLCIKKFEKENFLNFDDVKSEKNVVVNTQPNGQKKPSTYSEDKVEEVSKKLPENKNEIKNDKKSTPYPTMKVGVGAEEEKIWNQVLSEMKKQGKLSLYTALSNSRVKFESDLAWVVIIPEKMKIIADKVIMDSSNKKFVQDLVSKLNNKEMIIKYISENGETKTKKSVEKNTLGLDINIIE